MITPSAYLLQNPLPNQIGFSALSSEAKLLVLQNLYCERASETMGDRELPKLLDQLIEGKLQTRGLHPASLEAAMFWSQRSAASCSDPGDLPELCAALGDIGLKLEAIANVINS